MLAAPLHFRELGGSSGWRANSRVSTTGIGDSIYHAWRGAKFAWKLRKKKVKRAAFALESAHEAAIKGAPEREEPAFE